MAKSSKKRTGDAIAPAAKRPSKSLPNRAAPLAHSDIARRAYELYVARGGRHGSDLDDWLEAERELRHAANSTKRRP